MLFEKKKKKSAISLKVFKLFYIFQRTRVLLIKYIKTSLLRRLQEQTIPDEASPMGKIHHSAKLP
jgi:hypothetical protein